MMTVMPMGNANDWLKQLDWVAILSDVAGEFEKEFACSLFIDNHILSDIRVFALRSLGQYDLPKPNVAKIAGVLSFWFRKLKPISYSRDSMCNFTLVNELIALLLGLGICEKYKDDLSKVDFSVSDISKRVLRDWVLSFRAHSHSPSSSVMSFELIATADDSDV